MNILQNKPDICIINMNNNKIIDFTIVSEQYMRISYIQKNKYNILSNTLKQQYKTRKYRIIPIVITMNRLINNL